MSMIRYEQLKYFRLTKLCNVSIHFLNLQNIILKTLIYTENRRQQKEISVLTILIFGHI